MTLIQRTNLLESCSVLDQTDRRLVACGRELLIGDRGGRRNCSPQTRGFLIRAWFLLASSTVGRLQLWTADPRFYPLAKRAWNRLGSTEFGTLSLSTPSLVYFRNFEYYCS